ncbi:MAG TPA: hypothetical protein PLE24_13865, partial [Chitinispirillaceae bacterium]|nr:hypothetical protein [Chitinispirillaceae bacterium]
MMKRPAIITITGFLLFLQCSPVPVTGRRQLNLIPQSQILSLSYQTYDNFIDSVNVVSGTPDANMVKAVG